MQCFSLVHQMYINVSVTRLWKREGRHWTSMTKDSQPETSSFEHCSVTVHVSVHISRVDIILVCVCVAVFRPFTYIIWSQTNFETTKAWVTFTLCVCVNVTQRTAAVHVSHRYVNSNIRLSPHCRLQVCACVLSVLCSVREWSIHISLLRKASPKPRPNRGHSSQHALTAHGRLGTPTSQNRLYWLFF